MYRIECNNNVLDISTGKPRPEGRGLLTRVKDDDILDKVASLLDGNIRHIMETHGGYHITVDKNKETGKVIYEDITCERCPPPLGGGLLG